MESTEGMEMFELTAVRMFASYVQGLKLTHASPPNASNVNAECNLDDWGGGIYVLKYNRFCCLKRWVIAYVAQCITNL